MPRFTLHSHFFKLIFSFIGYDMDILKGMSHLRGARTFSFSSLFFSSLPINEPVSKEMPRRRVCLYCCESAAQDFPTVYFFPQWVPIRAGILREKRQSLRGNRGSSADLPQAAARNYHSDQFVSVFWNSERHLNPHQNRQHYRIDDNHGDYLPGRR